jgi:hypothetical protein
MRLTMLSVAEFLCRYLTASLAKILGYCNLKEYNLWKDSHDDIPRPPSLTTFDLVTEFCESCHNVLYLQLIKMFLYFA